MLSISIRKYKDSSNLCAKLGPVSLFQFRYDKNENVWRFWVSGMLQKRKEGRAFPYELFADSCRSVAFLKFDEPLSEEVSIISGKSYVK